MLTHGSLFTGIGGFDLGFECAGIKTIWQVEIDEYCRRVLARHFPDAERFADIRDCGVHNLKRVDIISGGFPCQDISTAGRRKGLDAERSGLWREYVRIIRELRPQFAVMENVPTLVCMGFGRILGELAESGYDAEWNCISAAAVGLPHKRERIWLVAYPQSAGLEKRVYGPSKSRCQNQTEMHPRCHRFTGSSCTEEMATRFNWASESILLRKSHGIPNRVDRFKAIGNAVVPQIAEWIGECVIRYRQDRNR